MQQEAFEAHMRLYGVNDVSCIGLVTGEGSVYGSGERNVERSRHERCGRGRNVVEPI